MDDNARALPIAIDHIDNLQRQANIVERDAFGAAGLFAAEQHRLTIAQPQLMAVGALWRREVFKHVLVINNTVLEDFDERSAAMGMRRLQHFWQIL